eukprot:403359998
MEYEKEIRERSESKMNWNIKNRWEQRQLDDVLKNQDIKSLRFRDYSKMAMQSQYAKNIQEFSSVDEIYYFMENMFTEGFTENHITIALDIFLRDAAQFEEKDLQSDTFKQFVRELGRNLITFKDEKSYVKTAKFLDIFCVDDKYLWINLEVFLMKKENLFKPNTMVEIMSHFASQNEGSRDFYDYFEFLFLSKKFDNINTHDLISLGYNFYIVHAGTVNFFQHYQEVLIEKLDDRVSTYDLLRILQTFSEISSKFPKLFTQLEMLFLKRFNQMSIDEMTVCACGFAISGYGSQYLFSLMEQGIFSNVEAFQAENIKEICKAFIFSQRGTKQLHQFMLPRIQQQLTTFSCRELCYLMHGYHKIGIMNKIFAKSIEDEVVKTLRLTETVTVDEIALIVKVFCTTRTGSREFHKLLETTVLSRLEDLKKNMEMLYQIGYKFEESGLCSLDTLKLLKKHVFMQELEKDVFN